MYSAGTKSRYLPPSINVTFSELRGANYVKDRNSIFFAIQSLEKVTLIEGDGRTFCTVSDDWISSYLNFFILEIWSINVPETCLYHLRICIKGEKVWFTKQYLQKDLSVKMIIIFETCLFVMFLKPTNKLSTTPKLF